MAVLKQIRTWFLGLNQKQRLMLAGGAVVIIAVLVGFVSLISKSDYKTLYSGSNPSDTQMLTARLDSKKIPYRLSPDGSVIQVSAEDLDKARLEIASDSLPQSGRLGFEIFDKPDWMGSDFAQKVNYQRALEGELERTIGTLAEVEAARVHIVMAHESLFTESEREAKASIVLKLRRIPSPESVQSIVYLVAGAVDDLRPENVTVVDTTGQLLSSGRKRTGNPIDGDLEQALTAKLLATLEPIVGSDHVRASVNVEYDLANTEDNREIYDPNSVVPLTVQKSEEIAGDRQPGGVPGTTSNVPGGKGQVPANTAAGTSSSESNRTESSTYGVSRTVHKVVQGPGGIKRISAAVLLDASAGPISAVEMNQITQLARAALDADTNRGDTIEVQSIPFTAPVLEKPTPPSLQVRVVNVVQRWTSLLRYVVIGLLFAVVYFFVLRPVRKQLITAVRGSAEINHPQLAVAEGPPLMATPSAAALPEVTPLGDPELRKEIVEKVKRDPANAGRLVQSWLRQSEVRK